ncbi:hypothetical protein GTC6_00865 [Gordonia terrae C-6]|uniref:Regulatory protein n=1 Tax=Gordonia terrae C-6 TaxID=1316928 RepID=R7YFQ4_9ACTN|nr:DUF5685 family protein [Gordonia terrae]EON34762.1 hypothetical protein GTC6_00865 [Gordonia terrae C-6]
MFGVLTPCRHALDDDLMDQWRSHLCGVCLSLRDSHGQSSRLTVNTDAVMVSILTAAQSTKECASTEAGRCPLRGMRTATVVSADEPGVRLATTASLTLAAAKAADVGSEQHHALAPRHPVRAKLAEYAGGHLRRHAAADTTVAGRLDIDAMMSTLSRQAEIESTSVVLDDLTHPSAAAAAQVFATSAVLAEVPGNQEPLRDIGADFGRIAHLLDAVDDYDSDAAEGRFNPLRATGTSPETALEQCRRLAAAIRARYADLSLADDRLLHVVLLDGLRHAIHKRMHPHADAISVTADSRTQWPPHRPFGYPSEWPYPPPFKPNRSFGERILPFIGVSCFGKACCTDHWNHFTDKYKDAVCDDCDCCDCCDCCDL